MAEECRRVSWSGWEDFDVSVGAVEPDALVVDDLVGGALDADDGGAAVFAGGDGAVSHDAADWQVGCVRRTAVRDWVRCVR